MKPIKTTEPAQWMIADQTQAIMNALNAEAQNALFVGGCVRNLLLDEPVDDIDIATKHTPQQVQEILNAKTIKTIPTGIDHGTITAIIDDHKFEITTLRKDVETDGRRAVVAFSKEWSEDAERRDFTINTLLADTNGNIFDPTGQGISDLENRKIIFVGTPDQRIREDYLRILRFFRFHALYGAGEPDTAALKSCKTHADQIKTLSRERVTQEFFKILASKHPDSIFGIMFENNVLKEFSDVDLELLKHLSTFQDRYGLTALSGRLWIFRNALDHLLIPKVFQRDIRDISKSQPSPPPAKTSSPKA